MELHLTYNHKSQVPLPLQLAVGLCAEICRSAPQKSVAGICAGPRQPFISYIHELPLSQGYQGAKETEQGKVSRLRDEAIKAAEDKKEEEKKREEEEREKKPGKDGIRVRLKIFIFSSLLFLELLQVADAAEPADRAEDQRLCEAADVRERSRVGDVEEEEALPNFCIRFVFLLSLSFFSFLFLSLRRKKQYTLSASGLSSFFTFMLRAQICSKIAS